MKRSKKRQGAKIDAVFAERTGVLQSLRKEYPHTIDEMIHLLVATKDENKNRLHEFAFEFDSIAFLHSRRLNSAKFDYTRPGANEHPDYTTNQDDCREKLERATDSLRELGATLRRLDLYHLRHFMSSYKSPTGRTNFDGPSDMIAEIDLASRIIIACQEAHSTVFKAPIKRRWRRPLRYVDAVRDLIALWEKYTDKEVPISKTHQSKVTTRAAMFIRLGMSLIDPKATDANVVTTINKSLSKPS